MDTIDEVEVKQSCIACNTELDSTDDSAFTTRSGDVVCESCMVLCESCEDILSVDDDYNSVEGQTWCETCTNNNAHWCDLCDSYFTGYTYGTDDCNDTMCERCYENNTTYCEDCDATYLNGCEYNHDEDVDTRLVHDYSYRPDPKFHSSEDENTRLYFGIEVETEVRGGSYENRRYAAEYAVRLEHEGLAYLKSDGSLECGFEIVSHPMTHNYFMNKASVLWNTIGTLKSDYDMMAWGTKTCGLHIHISRAGFNGGSHQHRFLQLVYNNKDFYEVLAGRSSSHWAKFDDNVDPSTGQKSLKHKFERGGSDRYAAVNTNNRQTLEMRIFRGSLNTRFIKSCIDLAHASVEFTRVMSVPEVREHKLDCINLIQYIRERVELYPSLNQRLNAMSNVIDKIERKEYVPVGSKFSE
jgi:DNA-dependent RNA polymerase auxiliary subunit epsilon